jgi:hypothetical protein
MPSPPGMRSWARGSLWPGERAQGGAGEGPATSWRRGGMAGELRVGLSARSERDGRSAGKLGQHGGRACAVPASSSGAKAGRARCQRALGRGRRGSGELGGGKICEKISCSMLLNYTKLP